MRPESPRVTFTFVPTPFATATTGISAPTGLPTARPLLDNVARESNGEVGDLIHLNPHKENQFKLSVPHGLLGARSQYSRQKGVN